ncbi:MAG: phosphopantothenoylcysteine decarboxylase [Candidatus Omnitrophica bacterium]|nr:phosphopantothenoylcysteine decarboxylase [Candidatus Omnitrophota bacterium]
MALRGKKILITCGPTWVAIDAMRVISNRSTGELGHLLAKRLSVANAKVTLLQGPVTHAFESSKVRIVNFCFFEELAQQLKNELRSRYDCIIHAAAVSDFKPKETFTQKIASNKNFRLDLVPTPKLINMIKAKQPKVFLVGFKLENYMNHTRAVKETKELFSKAKCNLVVANFMDESGYEALLLEKDRNLLGKVKSKTELARTLVTVLSQRL